MSSDLETPAGADALYRYARERAEMLQGLYIHTLVFAVVSGGLLAIDWVTGGGWWAQWPLLVWGIGYAIHLLVTVAPVFSPDWVERRAARIARKLEE